MITKLTSLNRNALIALTVINASAAATLLEQSYQSHTRAVIYGRTCINDRYHSIATMGQITFIFTVLGPSLNVPISRANPYTTALVWLW